MKELKILFMDDEIYKEESNPAIKGSKALKELGYIVKETDKMSEVLDSYYKEYHDIYVLDIDMSGVEDIDGNGTKIGEVLRRLNSISKIVMFSARGTIDDWFAAANYHFQAYVHKRDHGVEKLIQKIGEAKDLDQSVNFSLEQYEPGNKVLLYYRENPNLGLDKVSKVIKAQIKNPEITQTESLDDTLKILENLNPALIVFVHDMFTNDKETFETLEKILSVQPQPNAIFLLNGTDRAIGSILEIVNLRPFRLLNTNKPNIEEQFSQSIQDALTWYGKQEIFEFPNKEAEEGLVRYPLTPEEIDLIKDDHILDTDDMEEELENE